ncbi:MAG TPA: DUF3822 family protein [Bacteroidales bacterium]|nr:DUF3822 family protein [Bacteroidales bacterium]
MPVTELFDETLDINATENYELTVELSQYCLSFCILDGIRNKFIMLRSRSHDNQKKFTPEQIREMITTDDFLMRKYRKIRVVISSSRHTIIPAALYDPARKDEYFSFNHPHPESNIILSDRISDPDSFLLFSFHRPYLDIIREYFPGTVPYHYLRPLFNQIHFEKKSFMGNFIHANVDADHFTLIIFTGNVLKLCNAYPCRNVSDIMYHILNAFRSLGIKQEETIVLSGMAERFDDLSSGLSEYVRNIAYAGYTGSSTFSYVFNDIPVQRYLSLFSASACE